jgi:colicin import membrane protein
MKILQVTIILALLTASTATAQDLSAEIRDMNWIGFQQFQEASRVFVRTTEPVKYRIDASKPGMVEITLENTDVTKRVNTLPLDTRYFDSPVRMIGVEILEGASPSVRIRITLSEDVGFKEVQSDNVIALDFER